MRPAWGNPRGLTFSPAGENLFVAEFGCKADRDRVLEGAPWVVGKNGVILKIYDADLKPLQYDFSRMPIWARIMNTPMGIMNKLWAERLAVNIGNFVCVDADTNGRCWGGF
jgi:hypothetical protein